MPRLLFLHANGFPTGAYQQFLDALGRYAPVQAPSVLESPASIPANARWGQLTDWLAHDLAAQEKQTLLIGHSKGGYLSMMAAAKQPSRVAGIVLIDSPVVAGWRSLVWRSIQSLRLHTRVGPAPIAARRRFEWPARENAREFFSNKRFVQRWSDGVLDDFLSHALVQPLPDNPRLELRVPRQVEADFFAQLPVKQIEDACDQVQNAGISMGMIAGARSEEFDLAGRAHNERRFANALFSIDAHHLAPLEKPVECADIVARCLDHIVPPSVPWRSN